MGTRGARLAVWLAAAGLVLAPPPSRGSAGPDALSAAPASRVGTTPRVAAVDEAPAGAGHLAAELLATPDAPTATPSPREQVFVVDHVAPGHTVTRRIGLTNSASVPVELRAYGGGADVSGGDFRFVDPLDPADSRPVADHDEREIADWIRVEPSRQVLAPHQRTGADVTIAVPGGAAPGERYGVVWFESRQGVPDGTPASARRIGVRVYLSVGNGDAPTVDFTIGRVTVQRRGGAVVARVPVHNTGERAVDLVGQVRLRDGPAGVEAGPYTTRRPVTLAPDGSGTVAVPLDDGLPAGIWNVAVTLRSGVVERTRGDLATVAGVPGDPDRFPWTALTAGAAALVVTGAAAALTAWLRRPVGIPSPRTRPSRHGT